jgi:hypothetical protein
VVLWLGVGRVRVRCSFTLNPPLPHTRGLGYGFPYGSSKPRTWLGPAQTRTDNGSDSDLDDDDDDRHDDDGGHDGEGGSRVGGAPTTRHRCVPTSSRSTHTDERRVGTAEDMPPHDKGNMMLPDANNAQGRRHPRRRR